MRGQPNRGWGERHSHHFHHPGGPGFGWGPGPWEAKFFGGLGGFGGRAAGRRVRRGDVRAAVLVALVDGPAHGYEIMRRLGERSGGLWRPSPGSVYPILQLLEDEGLVRGTEQDGRRTYELTDEGRAEAERRAAEGPAPWAVEDPDFAGHLELKKSLGQLAMAAHQVAGAGSPEQIERAAAALREARQALYAILAES